MTEMFDAHIEKLAKHIADKAIDKDTPFAESLDAFKQLTAYYALTLRHREEPPPDEDSSNFSNFGKRLDAAQEQPNGRRSRS